MTTTLRSPSNIQIPCCNKSVLFDMISYRNRVFMVKEMPRCLLSTNDISTPIDLPNYLLNYSPCLETA